MKILIVNTFDAQGGASRAAYRLQQSFVMQSIDSQMLVQYKRSNTSVITEISKMHIFFNKIRPILDDVPVKFYKKRDKMLFSPAWLPFSNVVDRINKINPDIVHLHWICNGMIRIEDLIKIKAPIVWTLHDNWVFTGGCHIMWDCVKYQDKCGACPRLGSCRENDLSKKIFSRKKKTFSDMDNLTIVGVSKWLTDCSTKSSLLKDKKHINLPNPIDTDIFIKKNKIKFRELLKLPQDKKLILFGAMSSTSDVNKGFKELLESLGKLKNKNVELVVFGDKDGEQKQDLGFKMHYLGHINNDDSLVNLYSAADVMIVPSLQEAFGQTASEAMSCGTPTVAFATTGLLDIIDHKKNGYLARPFDTQDLADGIEWVLNNDSYENLCHNAREKVVKNFDSKIVAKKYIELYKEVLSKL